MGLTVSKKIFFFKNHHFKSIEANDSMASIDTRSKDGRIYVWGPQDINFVLSCRSEEILKFFALQVYIYVRVPIQSVQKPHATFTLPYPMMLYMSFD